MPLEVAFEGVQTKAGAFMACGALAWITAESALELSIYTKRVGWRMAANWSLLGKREIFKLV